MKHFKSQHVYDSMAEPNTMLEYACGNSRYTCLLCQKSSPFDLPELCCVMYSHSLANGGEFSSGEKPFIAGNCIIASLIVVNKFSNTPIITALFVRSPWQAYMTIDCRG